LRAGTGDAARDREIPRPELTRVSEGARGKTSAGAQEEPGAGGGGFVGVDLGVGDAGVVIDRAVHEVETDPGRAGRAPELLAVTAVHSQASAIA